MKLKKEHLSRIIVAGLMAGSIGMYTNVSSAAAVQNGQVTITHPVLPSVSETITNVAANDELQATKGDVSDLQKAVGNLKNQTASQTEELNKHKTDIENLQAENKTQQEQLDSQQSQLDDHQSQLDAVRGEIGQEVADRAEADEALKQEVTDGYTQADDAIRGEIGQEVADRAEADENLQNQINDHQGQLDEHREQLDEVRGDVGNLVANDAVQDETLADHQGQLDEHREQLDEVRGDVGNLIANDAVQDQILADHQQQIDDIQIGANEAVGVIKKDELAQKYNDTNYLTNTETMVDADKVLDSAIKEVDNKVGDTSKLKDELAVNGANTSLVDAVNAEASLRKGLSDRVDTLGNRVDNLEDRVGDVEDRIDKVGAMAAAIANLRTMGYDPEAPTEIAVGVGQYESETGLALGVFHYPNEDFMLSASISTSGDEVMGGIGATWKIGRKSAQERDIDDEKSRELKAEEKAAEMQEAAQKAKVDAQRERHAQMLAEREAANK